MPDASCISKTKFGRQERLQCIMLLKKREEIRVHYVQGAVSFALLDNAGNVDLAST